MKTTMGKRKKFFRAVAEGIVALSVAFNFVSCGKKTKTEATVLSLGISADDEAAEADMGNIVPFENIRVLLAEDNELNNEIASVLLRENGIEWSAPRTENRLAICFLLIRSIITI